MLFQIADSLNPLFVFQWREGNDINDKESPFQMKIALVTHGLNMRRWARMPEEINDLCSVLSFHLFSPQNTKPLPKVGFLWRNKNETTLCRLPAMSSASILQNCVSLGEHSNKIWGQERFLWCCLVLSCNLTCCCAVKTIGCGSWG